MDKHALRKALKRSGRTISGAAWEMGIDPSTLHRYLSGRAPVPTLVQLVVQYWVRDAGKTN